MTQPVQQFKEGDRVQLIRMFADVAVGTWGTILRQFTLTSLYDVHFDGQRTPRIVQARYLEPVPPAP